MSMKEMDCVELLVEKEEYARWGVHKGMNGWICDERCIDGCWLVNFPQYGAKPDIDTISIAEEDLRVVKILNARLNEEIKAKFDALDAMRRLR